jgi:hypothetical protein
VFTAELAENAEKKTINNLCVLSDLCGEIFPGTVSDFGVVSYTRAEAHVESQQRWDNDQSRK